MSALRAEQWFGFHHDGGSEDQRGGYLLLTSADPEVCLSVRPVFLLLSLFSAVSASLHLFSLWPRLSLSLRLARPLPGQWPWQVLQHICLKYARLQNLNFSTSGQYATLFTSLHSGEGKKSEEEFS